MDAQTNVGFRGEGRASLPHLSHTTRLNVAATDCPSAGDVGAGRINFQTIVVVVNPSDAAEHPLAEGGDEGDELVFAALEVISRKHLSSSDWVM